MNNVESSEKYKITEQKILDLLTTNNQQDYEYVNVPVTSGPRKPSFSQYQSGQKRKPKPPDLNKPNLYKYEKKRIRIIKKSQINQKLIPQICYSYNLTRQEIYKAYAQFQSFRQIENNESQSIMFKTMNQNLQVLAQNDQIIVDKIKQYFSIFDGQLIDWMLFIKILAYIQFCHICLDKQVHFWVNFFDNYKLGVILKEDFYKAIVSMCSKMTGTEFQELNQTFAKNIFTILQKEGACTEYQDIDSKKLQQVLMRNQEITTKHFFDILKTGTCSLKE